MVGLFANKPSPFAGGIIVAVSEMALNGYG